MDENNKEIFLKKRISRWIRSTLSPNNSLIFVGVSALMLYMTVCLKSLWSSCVNADNTVKQPPPNDSTMCTICIWDDAIVFVTYSVIFGNHFINGFCRQPDGPPRWRGCDEQAEKHGFWWKNLINHLKGDPWNGVGEFHWQIRCRWIPWISYHQPLRLARFCSGKSHPDIF